MVKKFENTVTERKVISMQISCIVEDATKSILKVRKFKKQKKSFLKEITSRE